VTEDGVESETSSDEPSWGRSERHDKIRLENEVSRRTFVGLRVSISDYLVVVAEVKNDCRIICEIRDWGSTATE
jgi:hypothetical protein